MLSKILIAMIFIRIGWAFGQVVNYHMVDYPRMRKRFDKDAVVPQHIIDQLLVQEKHEKLKGEYNEQEGQN